MQVSLQKNAPAILFGGIIGGFFISRTRKATMLFWKSYCWWARDTACWVRILRWNSNPCCL